MSKSTKKKRIIKQDNSDSQLQSMTIDKASQFLKEVKKIPKAIKDHIEGKLFAFDSSKLKKGKEKNLKTDAIFVDGGKGQLSAAQEVLDKLKIETPLFAIAKREEEVFTNRNNKTELINLNKKSEGFFLLQRLRDESHRFAISYNRNLRQKALVHSALDDVPGIGPATKKKLLRAFGSSSEIRSASDEDLLKLVSERVLKKIREYL